MKPHPNSRRHRMRWIRRGLAVSALALAIGPAAASAAVLTVDDDRAQCPSAAFTAIQPAINAAAPGNTIRVCAGTYAGNLVLAKSLTLYGAQVGVDARGRVASESTISTASGSGLELRTGSASSRIDGFTFSGGSRGVESTSGPIDNLVMVEDRFVGQTGSAIFLNDNGDDITFEYDAIDGSSSTGGDLVHLDSDRFPGFSLLDSDIVNAAAGTGLFSDGDRNVAESNTRNPSISGNLFDGNRTGVNIGRKSFDDAGINDNTFSNNALAGLQGGPTRSLISHNAFRNNGRVGLELTGFGGATDSTRGAQNNRIEHNTFTGNGFAPGGEAIFFSSDQSPGTISTNVAHENNISGNANGAVYSGTETIDVTCNWWGSPSGPSGNGPGTGDTVVGSGLDFEPWLTAPAPGGPCNGRLPTPQSKDDCKKNGWQTRTDDQGRPFKNQGDCVSYAATHGRNK